MAILSKIRQRTLFLIIIIALALFSFVLADLFQNGNAFSAKTQNTVGIINGKEIDRVAFMQKVEVAQRQAGGAATNSQVVNNVWEQEVRRAIMETQFEKLGMTVEKDQMRDALRTALASSPEFLNEAGLFDENKLNEYIANIKETSPEAYQSWIEYEQNLAANTLQQNYFNMVKAGLSGTLAEGKLEHSLESNKIDIQYVQIPYASIPDTTVTVSKSDISSYINEHKKQYEVEASRDIRYVEFREVASVEDENAIKTELASLLNDKEEYNETLKRNDTVKGFLNVTDNEEYVNAHSDIKYDGRFIYKSSLPTVIADSIFNLNEGEVYGPYKDNSYFKVTKLVAAKQLADSVQSSHIIVPFIGSMGATAETVRTKEQAKKVVDSLLPLVKNNKEKFNEVANEINVDGSKGNNGSIGWIRLTNYSPISFDPDFADFIFFNEKGSVDIVLTKFGYHIIRVDDKKNIDKAVQLATVARRIEPSDETVDKIFRDASNFEIAVVDGADFEATAAESQYTVRPVNGIKILDENIPGVGSQRPMVRWAFSDEAEIGDIKRFSIPNGYAIVQLVAKHEEGLMDVEEATVTALPEIRKKKKAEIIRNRVNATDLQALASAENTTVKTASAINMKDLTITGAGREPLVIGSAFGLKEGETSGLIDGAFGVYMVKVNKIEPAVELDNYQAAANRVGQQKANVVNTKLYEALKNAAEIEDNRAKNQIQ